MKHAKKLVGLLLAMVMVFAMSATVFAANITIKDDDATGSTYVAYKLLDATNAVDENGKATDKFSYKLNSKYEDVLKTVTGKDTESGIVEYISKLEGTNVQTFADTIYKKITESGIVADATASNNTFADVNQGYYLIAETATAGHPDTMSLVMLDTAGQDSITVTTKESSPSVEKKVQDKDDSAGTETGWQDSADYDIGDEIPYQITGTVSSKFANYQTYYYEFVDTMTHLTYKEGTVKVMAGTSDITNSFTTKWNSENKELTVVCNDLKTVAGVTADSKIVVTYTATLDEDAVIGATGNPNTVKLIYNNNPYDKDGGKPKKPGETPEDTNIVFTFKTVVNKVDKDGNALKGAGFTLYKKVKEGAAEATYKEVKKIKAAEATTFEFAGLDAGEYKLEETEVPAGYNKAADITFTIEATHEEEADKPTLKDLKVTNIEGAVVEEGKDAFAVEMTSGTVSTKVVNNSGTELPSTGGVGTTLFYVIGGILVLGAGVLLVSKKRMNVQ